MGDTTFTNTEMQYPGPAGRDRFAVEQAALGLGIDPSVLPILTLEPEEVVVEVSPASDLSDDEWCLLSTLIPEKYLKRPKGAERYRNFFNAMLWLHMTRAFENHLPACYGSCGTIRKLREGMAGRGDMQLILDALSSLGLSAGRVAAIRAICTAAIGAANRVKGLRSRSGYTRNR
jgi:transposase